MGLGVGRWGVQKCQLPETGYFMELKKPFRNLWGWGWEASSEGKRTVSRTEWS